MLPAYLFSQQTSFDVKYGLLSPLCELCFLLKLSYHEIVFRHLILGAACFSDTKSVLFFDRNICTEFVVSKD